MAAWRSLIAMPVWLAPLLAATRLSMLPTVLIGVVFGFLPANSAAKLNPVDALSRE